MVVLFLNRKQESEKDMSNITNNDSRSSSHVVLEPTDIWYWTIRVIIAVLTISGNGLVIYFIVFKRRLQVTNNWFVLSLAIADFCIGLFATPSGLACTFQFRCDWRVQITFYNFLLLASTLNLWAMAVDRYIAIVHSLRYTSLMTTARVISLIAMSWGMSFLAAFVRLLWLYDSQLSKAIEKYYRVVTDSLLGILSCVILLVIYLRILHIVQKLARQTASQEKDVNYNHGPPNFPKCPRRTRRNSSAKVLGCMILLFTLCFSLNTYISFCLNFKLCSVTPLIQSISLLLVYCNSAVNFVVYAFMKSDIRLELRRVCRYGSSNDVTQSIEVSLT